MEGATLTCARIRTIYMRRQFMTNMCSLDERLIEGCFYHWKTIVQASALSDSEDESDAEDAALPGVRGLARSDLQCYRMITGTLDRVDSDLELALASAAKIAGDLQSLIRGLHGSAGRSPRLSVGRLHASDARMGFSPPATLGQGSGFGFAEKADDLQVRGIFTPATERPPVSL